VDGASQDADALVIQRRCEAGAYDKCWPRENIEFSPPLIGRCAGLEDTHCKRKDTKVGKEEETKF
jgi:hypothetical protein